MPRSVEMRTEDAGFLRCDRPAMARRQLEVSVGLLVVILAATFAALIAVPQSVPSQQITASAPFGEPASAPAINKVSARITPSFRVETAARKDLQHGG